MSFKSKITKPLDSPKRIQCDSSPKKKVQTPRTRLHSRAASKCSSPRVTAKTPRIQSPLKTETPRKTATKLKYDRYVPNRSATDLPTSHFQLSTEASIPTTDAFKLQYMDETEISQQEEIAKACGVSLKTRILAFKAAAPLAPTHKLLEPNSYWNRRVKPNNTGACHRRRIPTTPERVLDAPGLLDDYYLNLLDWSCRNNLAVALEDTVYIWNGDSGDVSEFCKNLGGSSSDLISSLQWTNDGGHLAVGIGNGDTQIWDLESCTKIRTMSGHTSRVGVLSWDRHIVSSGCRDGSIWHHDVRVATHKVCGLKWRADGGLLASGANDNLVNIWDARSSIPKSTKTNHTAAVKAVAWCPWQLNLLSTGGGSSDRKILFWNTASTSSNPISTIDTGSQVTSLIWSKTYKELISSHGFPYNQLSIWSYPSCKKIIDIKGHDSRVLHTALSPDGETVVTGASDENLKFWKAFERTKKSVNNIDTVPQKLDSVEDELISATKRMTIR